MSGRASPSDHEPGFSLPAFERLAPPPPPALVASRIELHSSAGRRRRRPVRPGRLGGPRRGRPPAPGRHPRVEPATRLLAEVVLRPPDLRHLDAAFQALAASPRRESSLKVSIGDLYATRCATCDADARRSTRSPGRSTASDGARRRARPSRGRSRKHYRCTVCRDQLRRRRAAPGPARRGRPAAGAATDVGVDAVRRGPARAVPGPSTAARRWPTRSSTCTRRASSSASPRSSSGSRATCGPRPSLAALRLAFLHAILPASRLGERRRAGSRRCGSAAGT